MPTYGILGFFHVRNLAIQGPPFRGPFNIHHSLSKTRVGGYMHKVAQKLDFEMTHLHLALTYN